jgi:hypothetical protein
LSLVRLRRAGSCLVGEAQRPRTKVLSTCTSLLWCFRNVWCRWSEPNEKCRHPIGGFVQLLESGRSQWKAIPLASAWPIPERPLLYLGRRAERASRAGRLRVSRATRRATELERTGQHRTTRTALGRPPDLDRTAPDRTKWTGQHGGRKTHNPPLAGSSPARPTEIRDAPRGRAGLSTRGRRSPLLPRELGDDLGYRFGVTEPGAMSRIEDL